ncbi:TonB-dependent receptor [Empedobacter falsenii]|uniref:outer membrane beta-barrel family protein n=1 Tax=Empedobacter falsenii TaxID=343874 RepID=UPI0025789A31|nr:outer membrane beta-barrel family protein [Empedobacter falsenii]MDM1299240.1 TonB-dependent receptor [Empedobacter falsenii]MDM1319098.1 TonB-dependent receptor [Empedobacter falsenii]
MKKYFLPIICFAAIQTYAQQEVKGIIQYTNQTPVALADVVISQGDKIVDEISTDENGHFSVVLEEGSYNFKIEEAGATLHTITIEISKNADLGVILVPKNENVTLKEAVVTGQKKLIEKKVDRLIFNPDLAEGAKGGNALDALKLAPRVKVDESTDAVSIIGKGSVQVMINDRMMQMSSEQLANYLKTIRTEDIEKIEVITNPPSKYEASGNSGIINIVLKNAKQESINGSLSASYSQQKYGNLNLNGNVNYRKGKWTLTSNIYNGDGNWYNENYNKTTYSNQAWIMNGTNKNTNKYYGGRIGVDYQITDKLITGFNVDYSKGNGDNSGKSTTDVFKFDTQAIDRYITADRSGSSWDWDYFGFNYHVIKKFATEGKKLTFDFDYSGNKNDNNSKNLTKEFTNSWTEIKDRYQDNLNISDGKSNSYNLSLDMEHPVNSWKMNYGTRLKFGVNDAKNKRLTRLTPDTDYLEENEFSTQYKYFENISSLYYSVEKQLSEKWTAKAGLRYEHAQVKSETEKADGNYKKSYDGIYPTAYLMYQAAENHSFTLNYSRRVDRPYIWLLNPQRVKQNEYNYYEGNPNLTPSNSNNFELEYAYKDLTVTSLYYRNANDLIEQVQIFDDAKNITTSKPYNIGKTYSIGLSENINVKPVKWWRLNASADVFYRKTEGGIPEMKFMVDGMNGEFRITNNFDLNKKKTLFANYSFMYNTKSTDGLDKYGDYMRHNLGFRAMVFQKKLQLSLNVSNLFENKNGSYSYQSNNVTRYGISEPFRTFRFGISYNFGKQFKIERSKSNQEQSGGGGGGNG